MQIKNCSIKKLYNKIFFTDLIRTIFSLYKKRLTTENNKMSITSLSKILKNSFIFRIHAIVSLNTKEHKVLNWPIHSFIQTFTNLSWVTGTLEERKVYKVSIHAY